MYADLHFKLLLFSFCLLNKTRACCVLALQAITLETPDAFRHLCRGKFVYRPTTNANLNPYTRSWFEESRLRCQNKIICSCISAFHYSHNVLLSTDRMSRDFSQQARAKKHSCSCFFLLISASSFCLQFFVSWLMVIKTMKTKVNVFLGQSSRFMWHNKTHYSINLPFNTCWCMGPRLHL